MPRHALLLLLPCLLTACAQPPGPVTASSRSDGRPPQTDDLEVATGEVVTVTPRTLPALAERLVLHADPRVGDYVIHQRLSPQGLTPQQRRTEIIALSRHDIQVRRTLGDGTGRPSDTYTWQVRRDGTPGTATRRKASTTRISPPDPLHLVSGRFLIDQIQTWALPGGGAAVTYRDSRVPFTEVVSLTTREHLSRKRMRKLLGQIATLTDPDARRNRTASSAIEEGWLLMHWGRGRR